MTRAWPLTALLAWGVCGVASTVRFEALPPAWSVADYQFRLLPGRKGYRNFFLETEVATTAAGPAVRVAFAVQDAKNYYYAEASDTGCGFVVVEDGLERRIGTPSGGALARSSRVSVAVARWRQRMALWLDGRLVAEAYDGRFRRGGVAVGVRSDSAAVSTIRFQHVAEVRLEDDFMRTQAENTAWRPLSGSWKLEALPSASLSANAFDYRGQAADGSAALAVRGHWFWCDYVASAACKALGDGAFGLAFYLRDKDNYHLLRWNTTGRLELLRVRGGKPTTLAARPLPIVKGQWYRLGVRLVGRRVWGLVDGQPVVEASDPWLLSGALGLYCEGEAGAVFDDVEVSAPRGLREDFDRPCEGKWLALGGEWSWERGRLDGTSPDGRLLVASANSHARYVCGQDDWTDYTVATDLLPPVRGAAGLVIHYQDEANYYLLRLEPRRVVLSAVVEGRGSELAEAPCAVALGRVHRLALSWRRGLLTGWLDGAKVLEHPHQALACGRAGLYVEGSAGAAFDNLEVSFPRQPTPIFTTHEVFAAERSMGSWAARQSDWGETEEKVGGASRRFAWHRGDFYSDVELLLRPASFPPGGRLWLALAADRGANSGYLAAISRSAKAIEVELLRAARPAAGARLAQARQPARVSIERVGAAVLVHVDGKVALSFYDRQPLGGSRIGWAAEKAKVPVGEVEIFSPTVFVYSFNRAPVDWRAAAGDWKVTNRWACDPRWSFFAGTRQGDPLVALWNKRRFAGPDITLEFAAGIRHDPDRGGSDYHYASDINAVICGDGRDLRNGYNFVFGGWDNRASKILRNGAPIAQTTKFRFPRDYSQHRKWFYFKVQKRGSRLRFFVDNKLALEANDPQPLAGDRVALWSWNNDIMVARVRVSTRGFASCELPVGPPQAKPHCIYR